MPNQQPNLEKQFNQPSQSLRSLITSIVLILVRRYILLLFGLWFFWHVRIIDFAGLSDVVSLFIVDPLLIITALFVIFWALYDGFKKSSYEISDKKQILTSVVIGFILSVIVYAIHYFIALLILAGLPVYFSPPINMPIWSVINFLGLWAMLFGFSLLFVSKLKKLSYVLMIIGFLIFFIPFMLGHWQVYKLLDTGYLMPEIEKGDPAADWQTYRNEEYGFEIKYPVNEFIISDNDYLSICGDENFENLLSENNKFCFQLASKNRSNIVGYEFLPFYIVSIVGRNSEYQSAESYYAAKEKERINREPCGGCRGLYFDLEYLNKRWDTGGTPGVCDNYDYLTWSNKKEMVLAVSDCGQEPAEHLGLRDLFNQNQSDYSLIQKILSTFKFIE